MYNPVNMSVAQKTDAIDENLSDETICNTLGTAYKNETKYQALSDQEQLNELHDDMKTNETNESDPNARV